MKKLVLFSVFTLLLSLGTQTVLAASNAVLSLESDTDTVTVGETFTVQVKLDAAGNTTDEIDVKISYDPSKMVIIDGMVDLEGEQVSEDTILLEVYLENRVDTDSGEIFFEQAALDPENYYTSDGTAEVVAELEMRALSSGTAEMTLVMNEDENTTDSSVIDASDGSDVLGEVNNLALEFVESGEDDVTEVETTEEEDEAVLTQLVMESNKTKLMADGRETTQFTVTAYDQSNQPVSDTNLNFSTSLGTLSATSGTTDASGRVTFTLTSPTSTGIAEVQVSAADNPAVTTNQNITVEAVPAEEVIDEEETMPEENVSAGPDSLQDVGTPEVLLVLMVFISMLMAYTWQTRKDS